MRILVVQESDWLEKGPHQSHHLMERMSEKGHEVRVIDFEILWRCHSRQNDSLLTRRFVFEGVRKATSGGPVTVVRPPILRLPLIEYISIIVTHWIEIRRQLREFKPDVVIGFGILNTSIAIMLARSKGIPCVYYLIDELHRLVPHRMLRGVAKRIESLNMKMANLVLSINEALRQYTIAMGAPEAKAAVIGAGVDLERFNMLGDGTDERLRLQIEEDDLVLFFMGWLYEFSGLREVAEELLAKQNQYEKLRLLIVGKGELWDYLREKAERDPNRRIVLLDWQPYDRIRDLISASDICILPAHNIEIMQNIVPIKIYEYMAMGKPVLATDLNGLRIEFGEENGVTYVHCPEEILSRAIRMQLNDRITEEGLRARRFVQSRDWKLIVDDFEKVIIKLVSSSP